MINKSFFLHVLICFLICAFIVGVRSFVYPQTVVTVAEALRENIEGAIYILRLKQAAMLLFSLPVPILIGLVGAAFFLIGVFALKLFPKKIWLGAGIVSLNLKKIVKLGLLIYVMKFIVFMIFFYSVVGIPFIFFLEAAFLVVYIIGALFVAAFIGSLIQEMANGSDRRMIYNFTIGTVFMLLCLNVYAIGGTFLFFIFPVISYGAFAGMVSRRALNMRVPENKNDENKKFDREKMRTIITNGL